MRFYEVDMDQRQYESTYVVAGRIVRAHAPGLSSYWMMSHSMMIPTEKNIKKMLKILQTRDKSASVPDYVFALVDTYNTYWKSKYPRLERKDEPMDPIDVKKLRTDAVMHTYYRNIMNSPYNKWWVPGGPYLS